MPLLQAISYTASYKTKEVQALEEKISSLQKEKEELEQTND